MLTAEVAQTVVINNGLLLGRLYHVVRAPPKFARRWAPSQWRRALFGAEADGLTRAWRALLSITVTRASETHHA